MEIEKRYQKLGLSGDPAVDYDDIDFDVVPPLEQVMAAPSRIELN